MVVEGIELSWVESFYAFFLIFTIMSAFCGSSEILGQVIFSLFDHDLLLIFFLR